MHARPNCYATLASLAALITIAVAPPARAQNTCGPGQVSVDAVGHCCSPGQAWDATAGTCANVVAHGCGPGQVAVDAVGHCCSPGQTWSATANECAGAPTTESVQVVQVPGGATGLVVPSVAVPDPTAPVAVTFAPSQPGDQETLRIQAVTGSAVTCNVPCVVNLAPGYVTITGTGQRNFESSLNVPPFNPLTVQVNHFDSPAPIYGAGAVVTALGLGAAIAGIALLFGAPSCPGIALTPPEMAAAAACGSTQSTDIVGGIVLSVVGVVGLIAGPGLLVHASRRGQHPLILMDPGRVIGHAVAQRDSGWHFAGIAPAAIAGGAGIRAAITF